jgi:hypothetical protein
MLLSFLQRQQRTKGVLMVWGLLFSYYEAYNMIRRITGVGKGKGPIVVIHEAFQGIAAFNGFMPGADRLAIDREHLWGSFSVFVSD